MTEDAGPKVGEVWRYPFLWKREAVRGNTEGQKQRPCAVAMLTRNATDEPIVMFVPITTQPQENNPFAIEVPEIEKKRAGLDLHLRLWIVCLEHNNDAYERSYYLEPSARLGTFSMPFIKKIQGLKIEAIKSRRSVGVQRN